MCTAEFIFCCFFFSGYQPPLELLTQMLSQGGIYDRHRQQFQEMNEAMILAAATQPSCPGTLPSDLTAFLTLPEIRLFSLFGLAHDSVYF